MKSGWYLQCNHSVEDNFSFEKKLSALLHQPSLTKYLDDALASLLSLPKTNNLESNTLYQLPLLPF